jgi:hypothetical protein
MGSCNKDILPNNLELITGLVIDRLHLLDNNDITGLTAQELVEGNYCDPVRVFIKNEPHSTNKVNQDRWRLIFAVSVVDQLIERLLCGEQNKKEISTWKTHPSAPGIGLSDDSQLAEFYTIVSNLGEDKAEADVTGFDWSVQEWELAWEAVTRIRLGNMTGSSARIMISRYHCVAHSVYAMPCGKLVMLRVPGVQLSGCYNTSSTNSRIRVLLAYLVGARWARAMGDDCVEEFIHNAKAKYALLGHPLKMYEQRSDSFEFCSQIFSPQGAWPVDGTKTLFRLIEQKTITPELIAQFTMELRNSPRLDEFLNSIARVVSAGGQIT